MIYAIGCCLSLRGDNGGPGNWPVERKLCICHIIFDHTKNRLLSYIVFLNQSNDTKLCNNYEVDTYFYKSYCFPKAPRQCLFYITTLKNLLKFISRNIRIQEIIMQSFATRDRGQHPVYDVQDAITADYIPDQ